MCDVNISLLQNYKAQNRPWEPWAGASAHSRASCGRGWFALPCSIWIFLPLSSTGDFYRCLGRSTPCLSVPMDIEINGDNRIPA